jgi:hypothetical protein
MIGYQAKFIGVLIFLLIIASTSQLKAEPPSPPDGQAWNSQCHQNGSSSGDALEACCSAAYTQCREQCNQTDANCSNACYQANETCVTAAIVQKGGRVPAKPTTGGREKAK